MKSSCYFVFNHPGTSELKILLDSLLQLTTAYKLHLLSPINLLCGSTSNTSRGLYPLLCDVTASAEVCLPLRCLATDVLSFRAFTSAGTCLSPRCLAMGVHVKIRHIKVDNVIAEIITYMKKLMYHRCRMGECRWPWIA
jgi:hypothetical protein